MNDYFWNTNILWKCRSIKNKDRRAHWRRISTLFDFTLSFFSLLEDIEMYLIDCDQSFILHFYCIHLSFGDISKDKLFIYKLSILSDNWFEFFMMFSWSWQCLRRKNYLHLTCSWHQKNEFSNSRILSAPKCLKNKKTRLKMFLLW